jgi:hypothetical protein
MDADVHGGRNEWDDGEEWEGTEEERKRKVDAYMDEVVNKLGFSGIVSLFFFLDVRDISFLTFASCSRLICRRVSTTLPQLPTTTASRPPRFSSPRTQT